MVNNIEWCKPLKHKTANIILILMNNEVINIWENGNPVAATPEKITELAKWLNGDYCLYEGYNDTEILIDADFIELSCNCCPFNDVCEVYEN